MALTARPIQVIIADAYSVVRTGLVATIEAEPQMHVVGCAAHRHDLILQLQASAKHVLVIDLDGMGDSPVTLLRDIVQAYPQLGIVVFSVMLDLVPELLSTGAKACVSKAEPDEQLRLAIRAVHAGQFFVSPLVHDYLERCTGLSATHRFPPRELQIIACIVQGVGTNKQIADYLGISKQVVDNYTSSIRKKTGWTTHSQWVAWYQRVYGGGEAANIQLRLLPSRMEDRRHGT